MKYRNNEINGELTLEEHDEEIGELREAVEMLFTILVNAGLVEQLPYSRTFKNGKYGYTYLLKTDKPETDVKITVPSPAL